MFCTHAFGLRITDITETCLLFLVLDPQILKVKESAGDRKGGHGDEEIIKLSLVRKDKFHEGCIQNILVRWRKYAAKLFRLRSFQITGEKTLKKVSDLSL